MPSSDECSRDPSPSQEKTQAILAQVEAMERDRERKRLRLRPLGVMLFAALLAIYVVVVVVVVARRWIRWDDVHLWIPDEDLYDFMLFSFVYAPLSAVWAAALCYGLWNLQEWARHSVSGSAVLGFIRRVYGAAVAPMSIHGFRGSPLERAVLLEAIALILIAAHFQTPGVAAAFRSSLPTDRSSAIP